eukprot:1036219-Pyramimonas_sp.AAC.1
MQHSKIDWPWMSPPPSSEDASPTVSSLMDIRYSSTNAPSVFYPAEIPVVKDFGSKVGLLGTADACQEWGSV